MRALRHWKAILVLVLVFAAGGITGSVMTMVRFKHDFERLLFADAWADLSMQIMQKDLSLTPEQQPKIRAILEDTGRQFKGSFGRAVDESGTNLVTSWHLIDQALTPEQRVKFQRECQVFRERLKEALKIELPPQ